MSVTQLPPSRRSRAPDTSSSVDSGGGPPHDDDMLKRIEKLETLAEKTLERLTVIERDVSVMKSNYATSADLHKELHATTWKIAGTVALLCAAVFWMARNITPPAQLPTSGTVAAVPALVAPVPTGPTPKN